MKTTIFILLLLVSSCKTAKVTTVTKSGTPKTVPTESEIVKDTGLIFKQYLIHDKPYKLVPANLSWCYDCFVVDNGCNEFDSAGIDTCNFYWRMYLDYSKLKDAKEPMTFAECDSLFAELYHIPMQHNPPYDTVSIDCFLSKHMTK